MTQVKIDPKAKKSQLSRIKKLCKQHETAEPFEALCIELENLKSKLNKQKTQKTPNPPAK